MKYKSIFSKENSKAYLISAVAVFLGCAVRFLGRNVISSDMFFCLLPWYDEIEMMSFKEALINQVGNYNMVYQRLIYYFTKLPGEALYQYKILSVLFDAVLAAGVFCFARKITDRKRALVVFAISFLLPSVWINSAFWGQCDSIHAAVIIWALYFLYCGHLNLAFVLLGISISFKLQAVFILPFFGYLFLSDIKKGKVRIWHYVIALGSFIATGIPNYLAGRKISDIFTIYMTQADTYHSMSMNYPSIWCIVPLDYDADAKWAIMLTALVLLGLMAWFYAKKADVWGKDFLWCAYILSYASVFFLPAMHERYNYLFVILGLLLASSMNRCWPVVAVTEFITVKTYIGYLCNQQLNLKFYAWISLALFVYVLYLASKEFGGLLKPSTLFERDGASYEVPNCNKKGLIIQKTDLYMMGLLTLLFLIVGSMRLGSSIAPETFTNIGYMAESGNEVLLDLPQNEEISKVRVYLGCDSFVSVSAYVAENGSWTCVGDSISLNSAFAWNEIAINKTTYQIDLIFGDDSAVIGEIVCTNAKGEVVTPTNSDEHLLLFDEQEAFPDGAITFYDQTMYDEVYHGRTAYEFLHGYDIYENTHPPLGKLIISNGIALFGMNPFGYRIVCLLFGAAMIPLFYLFGLRFFGNSTLATLAGVLLETEFMHYTLSRIATVDIIVALFIFCMFYFLYAFLQEGKKRYLLCSGIASGLGVATKWTACYALVGMALILLVYMIHWWKEERITKENKDAWIAFIGICVGCFVVIPIIIYVLSYIPFARCYPEQGIVGHAISNSIQMFTYHKGAHQYHPYESSWYSWPIDWVPLVDSRTYMGSDMSLVATFVNPFVCYVGLVCLIYNIYLAIKNKNTTAAFLAVFYGCMYVPWMFISRTTFIYQYYVCSQVLILMICNSIRNMNFKNEKMVIRITGAASIAMFIIFFPCISGLAASQKYFELLSYLPKWMF